MNQSAEPEMPNLTPTEPTRHHWHTSAARDVARALDVDPASGLSAAEVARRLAAHGPNRLAETPPRPAWLRFVDQFRTVLIVILVVAAGLAFFIGDVKDMTVILIVVVFNAVLGFYQEHRAEQSLAALKQMLALKARVRRDGHKLEIAAEELVPGRPRAARSRRQGARRWSADRGAQPGDRRIDTHRRIRRRGQAQGCGSRHRRATGRAHQYGVHEHRRHPRPRRNAGDRHRHENRNGPHCRHDAGSA